MKVSVLGAAGGIGQPLSLLLKNRLPAGAHLALYDVNPMVPGVAADVSHIPTPIEVSGHAEDGLEEALEGADVVVIPAGVPRKPGMTRDDLFKVNAGIIRNLVGTGAQVCPKACWLIITNPVNSTVPIAAETLRQAGVHDPRKVFGVTMLDAIRASTFIGQLKGLDPRELRVPVIGGHSGPTILPLLSQLEGVEFTDDEVRSLTDRIQNAGTEVVEAKAGGGSATLSMAEAGARFTLAVIDGLRGRKTVQCTYVEVESMDTPAPFFAYPVQLGPEGVDEVLTYGALSDHEASLLDAMLPTLRGNIDKGLAFARG